MNALYASQMTARVTLLTTDSRGYSYYTIVHPEYCIVLVRPGESAASGAWCYRCGRDSATGGTCYHMDLVALYRACIPAVYSH